MGRPTASNFGNANRSPAGVGAAPACRLARPRQRSQVDETRFSFRPPPCDRDRLNVTEAGAPPPASGRRRSIIDAPPRLPNVCRRSLLSMNCWRRLFLTCYYHGTLPYRAYRRRQAEALGTAPISVLFYHRVADDAASPWTLSNRAF